MFDTKPMMLFSRMVVSRISDSSVTSTFHQEFGILLLRSLFPFDCRDGTTLLLTVCSQIFSDSLYKTCVECCMLIIFLSCLCSIISIVISLSQQSLFFLNLEQIFLAACADHVFSLLLVNVNIHSGFFRSKNRIFVRIQQSFVEMSGLFPVHFSGMISERICSSHMEFHFPRISLAFLACYSIPPVCYDK